MKKWMMGIIVLLALGIGFAASTQIDLLTQVKASCGTGVMVYIVSQSGGNGTGCDALLSDNGTTLLYTGTGGIGTGSGTGQLGMGPGAGVAAITGEASWMGPVVLTTAYNFVLPNTPTTPGAFGITTGTADANGSFSMAVTPELEAQTGADYTNAGSTLSTFQSIAIAANQTIGVVCELTWQGSTNATSLKLGVSTPASPTSVRMMAKIDSTNTGTTTSGEITSSGGTFTGAVANAGSTSYPARIYGTVENGSTAGTLAIQAADGAGATVTLRRDSSMCVFHSF